MDPLNDKIDLADAFRLSHIPLVMEPDAFEVIPNAGITYAWFFINHEASITGNTSDVVWNTCVYRRTDLSEMANRGNVSDL
jgi:hypothetical protein